MCAVYEKKGRREQAGNAVKRRQIHILLWDLVNSTMRCNKTGFAPKILSYWVALSDIGQTLAPPYSILASCKFSKKRKGWAA